MSAPAVNKQRTFLGFQIGSSEPTLSDSAKTFIEELNGIVSDSDIEFSVPAYETLLKNKLEELVVLKNKINRSGKSNKALGSYLKKDPALLSLDQLETQLKDRIVKQEYYRVNGQVAAISQKVFTEVQSILGVDPNPAPVNQARRHQKRSAMEKCGDAILYRPYKLANRCGKTLEANYPEEVKAVRKCGQSFADVVAKPMSIAYNICAKPLLIGSVLLAKGTYNNIVAPLAVKAYNGATKRNLRIAKAKAARTYFLAKRTVAAKCQIASLKADVAYRKAFKAIRQGASAVAASPVTHGVLAATATYAFSPIFSALTADPLTPDSTPPKEWLRLLGAGALGTSVLLLSKIRVAFAPRGEVNHPPIIQAPAAQPAVAQPILPEPVEEEGAAPREEVLALLPAPAAEQEEAQPAVAINPPAIIQAPAEEALPGEEADDADLEADAQAQVVHIQAVLVQQMNGGEPEALG